MCEIQFDLTIIYACFLQIEIGYNMSMVYFVTKCVNHFVIYRHNQTEFDKVISENKLYI